MKELTRESVSPDTGRELDAAVHERFFGDTHYDFGGVAVFPGYSTDFAHLGTILAELEARGWNWCFGKQTNHDYVDGFLSKTLPNGRRSNKPGIDVKGETLPQAVCRAAVMTVGAEL